jgi:hypothetical protein
VLKSTNRRRFDNDSTTIRQRFDNDSTTIRPSNRCDRLNDRSKPIQIGLVNNSVLTPIVRGVGLAIVDSQGHKKEPFVSSVFQHEHKHEHELPSPAIEQSHQATQHLISSCLQSYLLASEQIRHICGISISTLVVSRSSEITKKHPVCDYYCCLF